MTDNNARCTYCKNYTGFKPQGQDHYICIHCGNYFEQPLPPYDYCIHYKDYIIYYFNFNFTKIEKDGKVLLSHLDRRGVLTREKMIEEAKQFIDNMEAG